MKLRSAGLVATLAVATWVAGSAARATVFPYLVNLTGPSEFPVNASPGTGSGSVTYDDVAHTLALSVSFSGLTGTVSVSHLHAPTVLSGLGSEANAAAAMNAGVATTTPTLAGFPSGVTAGAYANVLDLTQASSWNPSYVTANGGTTAGAEAALAAALAAGKSYWNIHTSTFPGGEIRGFPFLVPEPTSATLAGLGLVCFGALRRRRK
jgi:hypothetical protein